MLQKFNNLSKGKKFLLCIIVLSVILFVITTNDNTVVNNEIESDKVYTTSLNPYGNLQERPVMNGIKTERIGTCGRVLVNSLDITEENLIEFYNNVVKDSGYNWVTLEFIDCKGTGIVFPGSNYCFSYVILNDDGSTLETKGSGFIINNTIEYEMN